MKSGAKALLIAGVLAVIQLVCYGCTSGLLIQLFHPGALTCQEFVLQLAQLEQTAPPQVSRIKTEENFFPGSSVYSLAGIKETLRIYEFATETAARRGASSIDPDGFSIDSPGVSVCIEWVEEPHFFQKGRIIVQYIGKDQQLLNNLCQTLGPQVAGVPFAA